MKIHSKEQIEATANAIKDHFIPKDKEIKTFGFHFTIPPASNYGVTYNQNEKGQWQFAGFEVDSGQ